MRLIKVRTKSHHDEYEIQIGRGLLTRSGKVIREVVDGSTKRLALVSNAKVFSLYGSVVVDQLTKEKFEVFPFLIGDGERFKSLKTVEKLLKFLSENGFERGDAIVALGGGVVGDAGGFTAAVYLRGIRYVQIPTTLLSQIDASIGGKTAVNLPQGKNLAGSFHQPSAVMIDPETLLTLGRRELVAGWCECVKQGSVGGKRLLNSTVAFLRKGDGQQIEPTPELEELIAGHCAFKVSVIRSDEKEDPKRDDSHSRRILNFGHTIGHALEAVTNYRRFRHGEAVGHGILVAAQLSKNLGLLGGSELEFLRTAVALCGPLPSVVDLDANALIAAIGHDKKRTSGRVKWVLLAGIGKPVIVDGSKIPAALLRKTISEVFRRTQ